MKQKISKLVLCVFVNITTIVSGVICQAQNSVEINEIKPYYINFNLMEQEVYEVTDPSLNIQYKDITGDRIDLILNIYNWSGTIEKTLALSKNYGVNYFSLNISDVFDRWDYEKIYRFEIINSNRSISTALVKKSEIKPNDLFTVGITASPINLDCKVPGVTVIDYFSNISGGKYPYQLSWMVYNAESTKLLNEPKFEILNKAGDVSTIRVDSDLNYNVFLVVKDACGNEEDQNLFIDCEMNDKNQNSLFIESLNPKILQMEN